MKCLLDIFVYQLQDRSSKAVFLRMHCAHLVYKLTKKKKIYLVHTITRLSTQSSIVSTKRKRTIPGAKKKKKKTESRFEIRDVVSYQRRTFSRGILFDPRVRKKKRSTRHIHEGRNEFSSGTKRGSHNISSPYFPCPSSIISTRSTLLLLLLHSPRDKEEIVAGIEIKLFPRLLRIYLASDLERFAAAFRVFYRRVSDRFSWRKMKFVCKSWDGGSEYSTRRYEEFIGTKLGIIKSRIEFLKRRINVSILHRNEHQKKKKKEKKWGLFIWFIGVVV